MSRFGSFAELKRNFSGFLPEKRGANPYLEFGSTAPPPPGSVGGQIGGLSVTTETASQIAAVYGCVSLLADSVSSLPLRVLDKPATVNTATEKELPPLLERPYELISRTDWIVQFVWSLALRGNFFGQIVDRDRRLGYPSQIMPVNPDVVTIEPKYDGSGDFDWRFAGKLVPKEDVFHVRYQSLPGMILGFNPIQNMRYAFGLAHVLDVHAEKFFASNANPQGVIQAKDELTVDQANKLKSGWDSAHQGPNLSNKTAVLDNAAEFKPISISPEDQQLLESRKWSAEEIVGMVFRIPPHMMGLNERSTSFGRGIEQQERTFVTNTLTGYLTRMEEALTRCLPRGQFANFDIRHRIRGDSLQRAEVAYKMILAGAWCGDDARATFDMPPAPEGQGKVFHSPTNSELLEMQEVELEKMEKELKEPAQPELPQMPPSNGNGKAKIPAKG